MRRRLSHSRTLVYSDSVPSSCVVQDARSTICGIENSTRLSVSEISLVYSSQASTHGVPILKKRAERTKARPLARGDITPKQAFVFLGLQLTAGLGVLTQLNLYR